MLSEDTDLNLQAVLDELLRQDATRTGFIDGERTWTYEAFDELSRRMAAWLTARGMVRGDRVAVWLVNRIEWLALLFGAARVGVTLVAVNTRYRSAELEYILWQSGARMLVLQLNFRNIDFPSVLAGIDPAALPELACVAVLDAQADVPGTILGKPAFACDALACEPLHDERLPGPETPIILFTTSGTTKGPKLVVHPQRTLAYHSRRSARAYGFHEAGACMLTALPFCGVFGLSGALAALAAGAVIVLMDTFDAKVATELIHRHRVTHTFGSDEMYRRLLDAAPGDRPFPSARVFGFAAFQPGAMTLAHEAWRRDVPLIGLYGSSEVQALFAVQPLDLPLHRRIEGGGRPAAAGDAKVRIRDIDTQTLLPPGREGEIEILAPSNFVGYFRNPQATAEAILPDGYFRTGDIGYLREDGTFVYQTRKGDAIRLGGFLVSPAEIEDVMKSLPGIEDAQVVAVDVAGQVKLVAFVVPAAGASPREDEVLGQLRQRIAAFKVPVHVWFVDAFPVTQSSNGTKIQRAKLRDMAMLRLQARDGRI